MMSDLCELTDRIEQLQHQCDCYVLAMQSATLMYDSELYELLRSRAWPMIDKLERLIAFRRDIVLTILNEHNNVKTGEIL